MMKNNPLPGGAEPTGANPEVYTMEWKLPADLACDHCVLQVPFLLSVRNHKSSYFVIRNRFIYSLFASVHHDEDVAVRGTAIVHMQEAVIVPSGHNLVRKCFVIGRLRLS